MPATGGAGAIAVKTARECQWTAQPEVNWITITAGGSGQGDGSVQFNAASNSDPVARTGGVMVNGLRAQITQAAGECRFELGSSSASFGQAGGAGSADLRASSALCTWTASSDAEWISITSNASGKGTAAVAFSVAPTTGAPRTGTLTIAGSAVTVTQSPGCTFDVSPLSHNVDASGGTRSVNVTGGAGCAWTASSAQPWITITSGASGSGSGTVTFAVAAATGPNRSGTLTVAGQTVTVTQGNGCAFAIAPDTQSVPASGGNGNVSVTAGAGCTWTAKSNVSWISVTSGASGSGNGTVSLTISGTNGPGRSGTVTIAGRTYTVNQGQGCSFSLSSTSASQPPNGGTGTFDVRTGDGCGWSAASSASWLTVTAGASGTGNGTVRYTAAANTGPQRTATITAGGQTFTVTQGVGCSYSIAPTSRNVASGGETTPVAITTSAGCSWNASSHDPSWISISGSSSGSGNGTVQIAVAPNTGAERRGTVSIETETFTVVQAGGCTFSLAPASQTVPSGGGQGSFSVTTTAGCAWTANADAAWLSITSGAGGTGPGAVQFSAAANAGAGRTGTITAAGQTFTVIQDSGCSAVVAPDTIAEPAAGGSQNVGVTTAADCAWTAASNAPWITIAMPASGTGNGNVQLDIQPNSGVARSGTATVAGQMVTVNQESGCSVSIAPAGQAVGVAGGTGSFTVTAPAGCPWTAVSNNPEWLTVTSGASGSGAGTVQFNAVANASGAARTGTITVSGQTFTVTQAGS